MTQTGAPGDTPSGETPRGGRNRSRTASRVGAVQALFQIEQAGDNAEAVVSQFTRHRLATGKASSGYAEGLVPDADVRLFTAIVRGSVARQKEIDAMVVDVLPSSWPMERLDPVLRALLRAAGGELTAQDPAPSRVIINEYMDVAHGFFSGDEPRMLNGVLDAMSRRIAGGEAAPATPAADGEPSVP
ncbi:transcription antitermination factor NusB [Gluconacetobacter entanii]|uniref:Transcription antitermination protein NusB n=1 Tax=Gluconacetobacter entanii TaxID=108528 RepID=A0A318PR32_9PROT|nr:transcription antitermination factor NusB [Gluconacetobacter entanii]MBE7619969.1 transcription antitermination factor NusB [Komagataeibacter sp. FXV2]MCE2580018.1 transcription antitermination factor NusB [Komagataeibacter sp. FNDCR1]MCW4592055.1 transcription antitermination factor NusB [Gluconacetobacter entanii]MCW4595200.1 transcription antitermination factor NusB [Gluconacetobacter entanii]NPC88897.1 transcription antitermination factor NusB [Gluconacetobacter entanii]